MCGRPGRLRGCQKPVNPYRLAQAGGDQPERRRNPMRTRYAVLLVAVLALAAAVPSAAAARRPKPIPAAAAFTLPSARACVVGHRLTLLLRRVAHVTWT